MSTHHHTRDAVRTAVCLAKSSVVCHRAEFSLWTWKCLRQLPLPHNTMLPTHPRTQANCNTRTHLLQCYIGMTPAHSSKVTGRVADLRAFTPDRPRRLPCCSPCSRVLVWVLHPCIIRQQLSLSNHHHHHHFPRRTLGSPLRKSLPQRRLAITAVRNASRA